MAEPDAAGLAHVSGPQPPSQTGPRSITLADIQRHVDLATAPLLAAQRQAERSMAPVLAIARAFERDHQRMAAMVDNGIGRYLRELVGAPALLPAAPPKDPADSLPPPPPPAPPTRPAASIAAPTHPRVAFDASPEAMSALVDRVAEAVMERLAISPAGAPATRPAPAKGRRGRRRREISVGGVDAALEALAEEDQSARALAARALAERVPYSRRTIENCATYKAWRRDLKALRREAAADGMADVLDAGLARIRKKKPGRDRLVDPTIDPAVEKMTREFLRLHGEEGLDGQ